jgi:hypothetical protein
MSEGSDENLKKVLHAHLEQIVRLKAETVATQMVLTGLMMQVKEMENGKAILSKAFEYASDQAIVAASIPEQQTNQHALTVGMVDHWQKVFGV